MFGLKSRSGGRAVARPRLARGFFGRGEVVGPEAEAFDGLEPAREVFGLVVEVVGAEGELRAVRSQLGQGGSDFSVLQELLEREKQLLARLEELMERWAYLSELAEANESR